MSMPQQYARAEDGTYFTGKKCLRGHISRRYRTGVCIECAKDRSKYRLDHYHKKLKRDPAWIADAGRRLDVTRRRLYPTPTREHGNLCECCGEPFISTPRLDHDHVTDKFRGWLCNRCNRGIGWLKDSIDGVQQALDYLKRNS